MELKGSIMKTKIAAIAVMLVLGTAYPARATPFDSNSIIKDGIEYYIQTDKDIYNLGENVEMLFRVTNLRDTAITIPCSLSPEFNLLVKKNGEAIWVLNHIFKWYSPGIELSAGASTDLPPYSWDMIDDNSNLVGPGIYDVVGVMYNEPWNYDNHGNYIPTEVKVPINIVPEPTSLVLFGMGLAGLLIHDKKRIH